MWKLFCFYSIIFSIESHLIANSFARGESSYYFTFLQAYNYLILCFLGIFFVFENYRPRPDLCEPPAMELNGFWDYFPFVLREISLGYCL